MKLVVAEVPSRIWELKPTFSLRIDRTNQTVSEYLESQGVVWQFGGAHADVLLYKGDVGPITLHKVAQAAQKKIFSWRPTVTLLGEPRELASAEYFFARPATTLAVAPGANFKRLFFANLWLDPQLDCWGKRLNRICWIGRPTRERIEIARFLNKKGIPLDIYSRAPWPLPNWKGFAEDEVATSRTYKYRIVCENSATYGYHSEKLFSSIRCGCVTFYQGDDSLDLSHFGGSFLPLDMERITSREEASKHILELMGDFMFTDAWEIYSFKKFYDRIIDLSRKALEF